MEVKITSTGKKRRRRDKGEELKDEEDDEEGIDCIENRRRVRTSVGKAEEQ